MIELIDRFVAKFNGGPGCWEWTASKDKGGYGRIGVEGINQTAHRVSYELEYGSVPAGMYVLHLCHNPGCVNPMHLDCGTQQDNIRQCVAAGRHRWGSKTHCAKGHRYTDGNTYITPKGYRHCKTCRARHDYKRRQKLS